MKEKETSWGKVADWYDNYFSDPENYHQTLVFPNLLRIVDPKKKEKILDIACGEGSFARLVRESCAEVVGVDISPELISIAKEKSKDIKYEVSSADDLKKFGNNCFDKISIVLAIQNIESVRKVADECNRVLRNNGKIYIVMNHPAFRIPKRSSWSFDEEQKKQYRRIDGYLSESKEEIEMHPGLNIKTTTYSFHRPLQYYFKIFSNAGFNICRLEEWSSNKKSERGPRQVEEDRMRKEIPLFLAVELEKKQLLSNNNL